MPVLRVHESLSSLTVIWENTMQKVASKDTKAMNHNRSVNVQD